MLCLTLETHSFFSGTTSLTIAFINTKLLTFLKDTPFLGVTTIFSILPQGTFVNKKYNEDYKNNLLGIDDDRLPVYDLFILF